MDQNFDNLQESNHTTEIHQILSNQFTLIFIAIHIFLAAVAFFGHALVCAAVSCFRTLRPPFFILIASLSAINLVMVAVFVFRMLLITHWRKYLPFDCHILSEINLVVVCIVLLHMSSLCLERFLAIKCALRYNVLVTRGRVLVLILGLWFAGVAGAFGVQFIPYIFTPSDHKSYVKFHESFYHCIYTRAHRHEVRAKEQLVANPYLLFVDVFYFLLPLTIILACSNYIYNATCHEGARLQQEANIERKIQKKQQMKLARALGIVITVFVVTVLPHLGATAYLHFHSETLYSADTVERMRFLMLIASVGTCGCLNPIVYVCKIRAFRKSFRRLLNPCRRRRRNAYRQNSVDRASLASLASRERVNININHTPVNSHNGKLKLWSETDRDLF